MTKTTVTSAIEASTEPLLRAVGVAKSFGRTPVLEGVQLTLWPGEVVAVMGENGAGKSTLMKIIAGVHQLDAGELYWRGEKIVIADVRAATERGIAFIHQELNLCDNLSVMDNVFLGREAQVGGWLAQGQMRQRTEQILSELGVTFSATDRVGELSIACQQMVEIAKALSQDAQLLIMDEPTSSLTPGEVQRLFTLIRQLRARGLCIVFISHRLAEVRELAERVVVLRDGRFSGELKKEDITPAAMVQLMVGRELGSLSQREEKTRPEGLLVRGLRTRRFPQWANDLEVRQGEIVGLAGLVGAGRTELALALFGIEPALAGEVSWAGQPQSIKNVRQAVQAGFALVPEDRKAQGVFIDLPIEENIALAAYDRLSQRGWVTQKPVRAAAEDIRAQLQVRCTSGKQTVGQLSGGNQQKIAIGRWLGRRPRLLIMDEPTRGVDVGAKAEIYAIVQRLADAGTAVLVISSEMEELFRCCDRVLVMHEGKITGSVLRVDFSEQRIMNLATGLATSTVAPP